MKLDYNLKLEQTQKLIITPELKMAIALLQFSAQELQEYIQEELLNNPVLELGENRDDPGSEDNQSPTETAENTADDDKIPWEDYFRDVDLDQALPSPAKSRIIAEDRPSIENFAAGEVTMLEDLLGQLRLLPLTPRQFSVAAFLAGNLDSNGYLQGDLNELASALGAERPELEEGLSLVQKLEPVGIGCRNLRECLLLQLKTYSNPPSQTRAIISHYLPAAADGRYLYIASRLGCGEKKVTEAVEFIKKLNPKPGSIFGGGEEARYIIPDVIVEKVDEQYLVMGNDSVIPQLAISPFYQKIFLSGTGDEQVNSFIKAKIEKALWLIRSIEQRRLTLFRVAQQIVDIQKPFLDEGIRKLKPLNLRDVASTVGVHESTVSRATANKFIQTPRGMFPLKFFFSSGLIGHGGSTHSAPGVKSYIQELVSAEDPGKPMSDQRLAAALQAKGINISRRTVAKYREEMAIPASYRRRAN